MPFFKAARHSQSIFWTAWPSMWQTRESDRQSLSEEDATLLPVNDDSLLKDASSGTRCWMLTLTIVNIVLFSLNIVLVFIANSERTSSPLGISQSKPRLNAALKELSSYCQSLNK